MPNVTKTIDRHIPPSARTVNFTDSDANEGDLLLIEESLGHPARNLKIEASGDYVQVRLNVRQKLFPRRGNIDGLFHTDQKPNLTSGHAYLQSGTAVVTIEAGSTYSLSNELPVKDLELLTVAGQFDIYAS